MEISDISILHILVFTWWNSKNLVWLQEWKQMIEWLYLVRFYLYSFQISYVGLWLSLSKEFLFSCAFQIRLTPFFNSLAFANFAVFF